MTGQQALDTIRQAMGDTDTDTARQRRSDTVLITKLNIKQSQFVRATKCLKKEDSLTLTAAAETANVPSDFLCLDPFDMVGDKGILILNDVSLKHRPTGWLDCHESGWRSASAAVPDKWHMYSLGAVRFNCPLSATAAAYTCLMRYVYAPTDFTAATLSSEMVNAVAAVKDFHMAIVWDVICECKKEDGLLPEADRYQALYMAETERAKGELGKMLESGLNLQPDPQWTAGWQQPPS